MRYNGLWSHPQERTRITFPYVWWDGIFSDVEINQIAAHCQAHDSKPGVTFGGANEDIRVSSISWHRWSEQNGWMFDRLNETITAINNRWYGFELNGYDAFQFTEYHGEQEGKYDWH